MSLRFRTHISSSRGNCIQLDYQGATLLLDCGFTSQRACNAVLDDIRGELLVLVSHAHRDHLSHSGMKALAKRGIPLRAHADIAGQLSRVHEMDGKHPPMLSVFTEMPIHFGPFYIRPVPVRHAPGFANYAFVIECGSGSWHRKLVVCTDLWHPEDIATELLDCDLIYLESNHDLELLRRHFNYASKFHLSNPKAGQLLCHAIRTGRKMPQAIVLGHLSQERNRPGIALDTIRQSLQHAELQVPCGISAAPALEPSPVIEVD